MCVLRPTGVTVQILTFSPLKKPKKPKIKQKQKKTETKTKTKQNKLTAVYHMVHVSSLLSQPNKLASATICPPNLVVHCVVKYNEVIIFPIPRPLGHKISVSHW